MSKGTRISKASQKRAARAAEREAELAKERAAAAEQERLRKQEEDRLKRLQKKVRPDDTIVEMPHGHTFKELVLRRTKTPERYMLIDHKTMLHAGNAKLLDDVVTIGLVGEFAGIPMAVAFPPSDRKKLEKAMRVDFALRNMTVAA